MGGGMIIGTMLAGSSALSGIAAGRAQDEAYKAEADQAELQALSDETERRSELNRAMAMQNVMFAASGRAAGEGSAQKVIQGDITAAGRDIDLIRAGGKATSTGLKAAGQQAKVSGYSKALTGAGKDMFSMYSAGAFSSTPTAQVK